MHPTVGAPVTAVDTSLTSLALQIARLSATELDLAAELGRLCRSLPSALGVAAAVIMVTEPSEENPTVVASDAQAGWIGEAQRRTGAGPLPGVIRTGRPLLTPDLTRLGPPELAAAAAQSGWTSSLVLPLQAGPARFGGLQLLGGVRRPVHPRDGEAVQVVVDVLAARLVDVRALRTLVRPRAAPVSRVDPGDVATAVLPVVRTPPTPTPPTPTPKTPTPPAPVRRAPSVPAQRAPSVPAQRRPQARHRRVDSGGS